MSEIAGWPRVSAPCESGISSPSIFVAEAIAENHLHDQMIGAARRAHADAEVELPVGREIQIEVGVERVLLRISGENAVERTDYAVIFESRVHLLGHVIADLDVRREHPALSGG